MSDFNTPRIKKDNLLQKVVALACMGLVFLGFTDLFPQIAIPRYSIVFTVAMSAAGLTAYWLLGEVAFFLTQALRKLCGTERMGADMMPENGAQRVIYIVSYIMGFIFLASVFSEEEHKIFSAIFTLGFAIVSFLAYWLAGEFSYLIKKLFRREIPFEQQIWVYLIVLLSAMPFLAYWYMLNPTSFDISNATAWARKTLILFSLLALIGLVAYIFYRSTRFESTEQQKPQDNAKQSEHTKSSEKDPLDPERFATERIRQAYKSRLDGSKDPRTPPAEAKKMRDYIEKADAGKDKRIKKL